MVPGGTGTVTYLLFHNVFMKKCLFAVKAAFSLLLLSSGLAAAQPTTPNLLINGDFEDRNHAPRGQSNIGPVDRTHPYDDLKNWYHPGAAPYYGAGSSDDSPDYLASDATDPYVNTSTILSGYGYGGFPSHSGISCVGLLRHNQDRDIRYDEFVTQQLGQALLPGHLYHAEFWVLRLPGGPFHNKLSLNITDADPIFDANSNQNKLIPSSGNKVIVSDDIQQRLVWTKASGDIVIPGSETNNRWVTIGFTREGPGLDATLPDDYPLTGIYYAIDDVSLVDMGCATVATPGPIRGQYNTPPGRIRATISAVPGATSYDWYVNGTLQDTHAVSILFDLSNISDCNTPEIVDVQAISGTCKSQMVQRYFYPICPEGKSSSVSMAEKTPVAYPNPATELIRIPDDVKDAVLLNSAGKPVRSVDKSGMLDVQSVPAGLYNLQMMQDGKLINQRIQVKH